MSARVGSLELLKDRVSIPKLLDYWSGDEECPGAFLLSELRGQPLTKKPIPTVAFQGGGLHATMHQIQPPTTMQLTGIQNEFSDWSSFVERFMELLQYSSQYWT